jgi:hypothetical protein
MRNHPEIAAPLSTGRFSDYRPAYQEAMTAFLQNLGHQVGSLPRPDLAYLTLLFLQPLGSRHPDISTQAINIACVFPGQHDILGDPSFSAHVRLPFLCLPS